VATRTFLNPEDLLTAAEVLLPPVVPPSGDLLEGQPFPAQDFSSWLNLAIESRLRGNPLWVKSHPIAIGSWGRGELCPQSDLDVVFCGEESVVSELTAQLEKENLPIKFRYPKNRNDWSEGGNVFETNALFWARPFTKEAAVALQEQKKKIFKNKKSFRNKLLKEFEKERARRNHRYDSMANYLEPQLKFGAGGVRDIQQALMIWFWFPEKMVQYNEVFAILQQLKGFLVTIRQKMHLLGYGDSLVAPAQFELAKWFGYKSQSDFMRELQKVLERVSFYTDLIFEVAGAKATDQAMAKEFSSPKEAIRLLKKDHSLQMQARVLHNISKEFKYEHQFLQIFNIDSSETLLRALFRSQLIQGVLPEFSKVHGVVQHDQYHRFTVDAHIFQAVRRVKRIYEKPALIGKLATITKAFKKQDWEILLWSALYHDLGKARGKDHSIEGKALVEADLPNFNFSKAFVSEVAWMVENHLVLSTAAFRKDPHSPQLWAELFAKGIHGERLRRLAVFTATDIYATNPEAWTPWKEKLLFNLVKSIETPQGNKFLELKTQSEKFKLDDSVLQILDQGLLTSVPIKNLVKDLHDWQNGKIAPVLAVNYKTYGMWVRFYNKTDQSGLFLQYVSRLWQAGVVIHHAYIHTHDKYGVYDWFEIKTTKNLQQIRRILEQEVKVSEIKDAGLLAEVKLITESEKEWVWSFRGQDKKGVLVAAARALHDLGLHIRWAKIHTWGRQVDDVFGVIPDKKASPIEWTQQLSKRLVLEGTLISAQDSSKMTK
jgi:[protein-PII] uridylyltransferase